MMNINDGLVCYGADTTFHRTYFYSLCMICSKAKSLWLYIFWLY